MRLAGFGEDYTNERIYERVIGNPMLARMCMFHQKKTAVRRYCLVTRSDKIQKVGGLKGLYLRYCYSLGYLPKYKQNPNRIHYLLKDDLMRLDRLTKEVRLLCKNEIETDDDLKIYRTKVEEKISTLQSERKELRNEVRRQIPEKKREYIKSQIADISKELKRLREEAELCSDIKVRSGDLAQKLDKVRADEERKKEKEMRR